MAEYTPQFYLSVPQAAIEMHTTPSRLREMAMEGKDPFPIRYMPWCKSHGIVSVREMGEWFERNARAYQG